MSSDSDRPLGLQAGEKLSGTAWCRNSGRSIRRMRVLHVINGLSTGGAEAVLYRLTTYPSDIEHEVVCLQSPDWYSEQLAARGVRVHHFNWSSPASVVPAAIRLYRLIKRSGADVIQAWMYRSNTVAAIAARLAGRPVIWNIRSSAIAPLRLPTQILAYGGGLLARWLSDAVINCSEASQRIHARLGYESVETTVIPNGYDPASFQPDDGARARARAALGLRDDEFIVGSIGRWDPHKGYPVLLRALAVLRERGDGQRLLLIGRDLDTSNDELMELIKQTGCEELVRPIGPRTDIQDIARALDLHVLASVSEGFPNVVAETMLSGTPNVVTDAGDAGLIVGDTGWVIARGDAPAIADAIQAARSEWSDSPENWAARRKASRRRIIDNFSLARMVEAYERVWRGTAARKAAIVASRVPAKLERPRKARPAVSRPLRILHIINDLGLGGAETLLFRLTTRGSENEHVVVSLGRASWYSKFLEDKGVPLYHLDINSPGAVPKGAVRLKRIIADSGADVVQCWMYRSNVFGGVIAKAAGKPVVWGIHCASFKPLRASSRAMVYVGGVLARWNPNFIVSCSAEAIRVHDKLGYGAAECAVIHNGYDSAQFIPDEAARVASRKALGIGPSDFLVGTVSRWDPLKDIPNFLAALRIARARGVPLRGVLIGAGLGRANAALAAELERAGCADFVEALGPRNDLPDLARAIDLHVLASRTEAFPNVVAETMLSGTPNAVTDVGDSALMIGDTGWLAAPKHPDQLADAIVEAYAECKERPRQWASRRRAARKQIADKFSLDRMSDAYAQVWLKVAAAGTPSSESVSRTTAKKAA